MNNEIRTIENGVTVRNFVDPKFKTMRISMNFVLPLEAETVAANAILPALVTRSVKAYPEYSELCKHLAELYGASLSSSLSKIGDNEVLCISVSGISDKYTLGKEKLSEELTELLCSAVFDPYVDDDGCFPLDGFNQEKRQILETIDANFNDKKAYAKRRCLETVFADEPAGISRYSTKERTNALKRETLLERWVDILKTARIEIFVLGDCNFQSICKCLAKYFCVIREPIHLSNKIVLSASHVTEASDTMKLSQSKMVMAFRTGVIPEDCIPTRVMAVLFGGSPSSKLFLNVREKQSLCYYCSARVSETKGVMFVESGVETANLQKARDAVIKELEDVKNGDFSEEDLQYAKLAMMNSYKSVTDSLYSTENWYLNQIFDNEFSSPEETIEKISSVTRIQVIEAARKVSLDTVYMLKGE